METNPKSVNVTKLPFEMDLANNQFQTDQSSTVTYSIS